MVAGRRTAMTNHHPVARLAAVTRLLLVALAAAALAGCSLLGSGATPGPSIIPGPSLPPGTTLDPGDLRLALVGQFGPRWYCDPDEFPLPHGDEQSNALARFAEMQAEGVIFGAVVRNLGFAGVTDFTTAQKVQIYRLWKVLLSLPLDAIGSGTYRFDYTAQPLGSATQGVRSTGTITDKGQITIEAQAPADAPNCPICLARGTRIDGPNGSIAVEAIRLGDRVWTLDATGQRIAGTVIAIGSTVAPADHQVIRLVLADGRSVTASPGHPLADGRRLGTLRVGDLVDGSAVASLTWLPYGGGETFDLVVSGPTGVYLSDGIPLGTTLR
jgi:Hint domain-containing protein